MTTLKKMGPMIPLVLRLKFTNGMMPFPNGMISAVRKRAYKIGGPFRGGAHRFFFGWTRIFAISFDLKYFRFDSYEYL